MTPVAFGARKAPRHKTLEEVRKIECQLHKLNALQSSVEEQNTIIHTRVARRKEQQAAWVAAKRAEGQVIEQESLLSKEGIEQTIRDNFSPGTPLHKYQKKHQHKFFRFVHAVMLEHQRKQATDADWLEISKYVLEAHTAKDAPFSYLEIRELLVEWGIIEFDQYYARPLNGEKGHSRSYRLGATFQDAELRFTSVPRAKEQAVKSQELRQNLDKLKKITDHLGRTQFDPVVVDATTSTGRWLLKNLGRLRIDQEAAFAYIDQLVAPGPAFPLRSKRVKENGRMVTVNRTMTAEIGLLYKESVLLLNRQQEAGQVEARFSATNGRLNTSFTRLFTCGRDYTIVDGKRVKLVSLDLACSQPYLLNHRLRQTPAGQRHLDELDQMQEIMRGGKYYEDILKACKEEDYELTTPVSEAKTELFRNLQYSKNHRNTPYRRAFNKRFPGYHEALMELVTLGTRQVQKTLTSGKKVVREEKVYRNLAIELQRVESDLFLNVIAPRLHAELGEDAFILTVHDSFYCLPNHAATVARVMHEVLFEATGYAPTIKKDGNVFDYRDTAIAETVAGLDGAGLGGIRADEARPIHAPVWQVQSQDHQSGIADRPLLPGMVERAILHPRQPKNGATSHPKSRLLMSTSEPQPIPFRGHVPEPRGSIRVFRSYDELPDKWKKVLAGAQPTPAGQAVPVPTPSVPPVKEFQYSDFF